MDYEHEFKKLRKQKLMPSQRLWARIEDTLAARPARAVWPQRLAVSASALAVFAVLMFGGADYYSHYRLEQYLLGICDYPVEYYDSGTFI